MKRTNSRRTARQAGTKPAAKKSASLDAKEFRDWREEALVRMRALILAAVPGIIEEQKWKKPSNDMQGIPVWSQDGIVCTGETYSKVVKLTFAHGARLPDPMRLFNASLTGNARRAIDIREGDRVNAAAFKALVKAAAAHNAASANKSKPRAKPGARSARVSDRAADRPAAKPVQLLSGGNPQIAKADGDAPVQAYIDAMPGWKRDVGRRLDALVVRAVPNVRKAVKWNSPFYGVKGQGWFLGVHCFTKYVKVTFFQGATLRPVPPGGTAKSKNARWLDVYEGDELDEATLLAWFKQAAASPGWLV
jgi:hypothetical protein